MAKTLGKILDNSNKYSDIIIAFAVVGVIGLIIIPVPSAVLDILLVLNITLALIIFLLTLFTTSVLDFSSFPTVLLVTTMFSLGLNVSSTRLILSEGDAGEVINAFAEFVTGNNYIVGAIIFIIIIIVQMVVVTSGSSRVSEVSARFTLDSMPGKQMSIDADLNAGLIDEETAKQRRRDLEREAGFFGAMDGASKFVKGDAIAGIIITVINLLGGILIFSINEGMGAMEALDKFGKLTIGDGLVSQVPSLLISVASGILVTRGDSPEPFGSTMAKELFGVDKVLLVAAVVLVIIGLVPGFPTLPFFIVAMFTGTSGYLILQDEKIKDIEEVTEEEIERQVAEEVEAAETITTYQVDPISLEIGYGLISLVDEGAEGNLPSHITGIRKQCARELGIIVNPIRINDNLELGSNDYVIKIKGNVIARGQIYPHKYMVIDPEEEHLEGIDCIPTKEPAFGLDAVWIDERDRETMELYGYTIVEAVTVLVTHLKEVIKANSYDLLGRQEVQQLLSGIKDDYDVVIDELIPDILSLGEVQKVLQNLLKENIPIYDLVTILETLADHGPMTKDTEVLTEYVRHSLGRTIVKDYINEDGVLPVVTIDPAIEELIAENTKKTMSGSIPVLEPNIITAIFDNINHTLDSLYSQGIRPVILASPKIRVAFRNMTFHNFPDLPILSLNEVPNDIDIESVGMVGEI